MIKYLKNGSTIEGYLIYPHLTFKKYKICLESQVDYYSNKYGFELDTGLCLNTDRDSFDFKLIIFGFGFIISWKSSEAVPF